MTKVCVQVLTPHGEEARHGRWRWALLLRCDAMVERSALRWSGRDYAALSPSNRRM